MATLLLATAGGAVGTAIGGTTAIGAATMASAGQIIGAMGGKVIDQKIFGNGSQPVQGPSLQRIRIQSSTEGSHIPRVWGAVRIAGQLIWSTKFRETITQSQSQQGSAKGLSSSSSAATGSAYSYDISFALLLAEGKINNIGRMWTDGKPLSPADVTMRLYKGDELQTPDSLIEAAEGSGNVPAYRGMAYIVFENFPLSRYGNRIPQITIEVFRKPQSEITTDPSSAPIKDVSQLLRGVALSPGSGEFSLATTPVSRVLSEGNYAYENLNNNRYKTNITASLDDLETEAPNCRAVSLIVSWFGTDLSCAKCEIKPGAEAKNKSTQPLVWQVSGFDRKSAHQISHDPEDRPYFGGTPSDNSVIEVLQDLQKRNFKVLFYPFILMDIPPGNTLVDPWTGESGQPSFPWRGRITLSHAPGINGSPDKTLDAEKEVDAFFGTAQSKNFTTKDGKILYEGEDGLWRYRHFILHCANLCKLAGGVDAFCIGSEMRSLTQIRSSQDTYPAVKALQTLANDVKSLVGDTTKVGYAADWSEYFGHHPQDQSGDVFFHLDPLWADNHIDFIGIDNYMPLADWRDTDHHLDMQKDHTSTYSRKYLQNNIEGGEGYHWYYNSWEDRLSQTRTPITDTVHGEEWIFRYKDIRSWWSHKHHNRVAGIPSQQETAWEPESKPIWFTEIGCPAINKGANQPNVFFDVKSSESALPYFSSGIRDDYMQKCFLQSILDYWDLSRSNNPVSQKYGGSMIDCDHCYAWTWDTRPWPDFPARTNIWSDTHNYARGHWIQGRLGAAPLAQVVKEICHTSGIQNVDTHDLRGEIAGFLSDRNMSARELLQPLMLAKSFDALESGNILKFMHRGHAPVHTITPEEMVVNIDDNRADSPFKISRTEKSSLPNTLRITYIQSEKNYAVASVVTQISDENTDHHSANHVEHLDLPIVMSASEAQNIANRWIFEAHEARNQIAMELPPKYFELETSDIFTLQHNGKAFEYRIDMASCSLTKKINAVRTNRSFYTETHGFEKEIQTTPLPLFFPPLVELLDLPILTNQSTDMAPWIVAYSNPWPGGLSVYVTANTEEFEYLCTIERPAIIGRTVSKLKSAHPHIFTKDDGLIVKVSGGELHSYPTLSIMNGKNMAALKIGDNTWEIIQFQTAELIGENTYHLRSLLRGQAGTEHNILPEVKLGTRFVLLDEAAQKLPVRENNWGLPRQYRIGPAQRNLSSATYVNVDHTYMATELQPWAPAHLRAARNPKTGDIFIQWIRRERFFQDTWQGNDLVFVDSPEKYSVSVSWGNNQSRIFDTTRPYYTYSNEQQVLDQTTFPLKIDVARVSDVYGSGIKRSITINE